MARKFFVGGNFKMNPVSRAEKHKLVEALSKAEIDTNTGMCYTMISRISSSNVRYLMANIEHRTSHKA